MLEPFLPALAADPLAVCVNARFRVENDYIRLDALDAMRRTQKPE